MAEKCFCGEELVVGLDGIARCKNGHENKKKPIKHYAYPLGEDVGSFKK